MRNKRLSKILDKYLPADGVGTKREKLRMDLHRELSILVESPFENSANLTSEKQREVCEVCGFWLDPSDGKCLRPECDNY
jgi:hypothetical protein